MFVGFVTNIRYASNELRWDRWEAGAKGDQRWLFDDRCYIDPRWFFLVWCRSVVFDGSIYVVGGSNDGESTSVECFTPGPPGSKPVRHQVRYAFFLARKSLIQAIDLKGGRHSHGPPLFGLLVCGGPQRSAHSDGWRHQEGVHLHLPQV